MGIVFRGTRAQLRALLRRLPGILAGTAPDPDGIGQRIKTRIANAFLRQVQIGYRIKSVGGTDAAGITWPPPAQPQDHPLLIDTERLYWSLDPGAGDTPSGNTDQVLEQGPGTLVVGTETPYAGYQFYGTRRIPARPVWPPGGNLPSEWWEALFDAVQDGIWAEAWRLANP